MSKHLYMIAGCCLLLAASGCSLFSGKDKNAYSNSRSSKSLEAPPDLVIPVADSTYTIPETVRASEVGKNSQGKPGQAGSTQQTNAVAPEFDDISLERDGKLLWLHVKSSPEKLWQPLLNFWKKQDVELEEIDRELGLMRTVWVDQVMDAKRGKVSAFFSKALGTIGGGDLRVRYRLRIERDAETSNIFLSYQAQEKVFEDQVSGESGAASWQMRPIDTEAEALMLKRIQQYLASPG